MKERKKTTLMQLQVSLWKKVVITAGIMCALILLVYYGSIPNPNMILIAGLVLCSALFGFGGGIVGAVIMFGYTLFFFSTDNSFTQFTPQNMLKVVVSFIGIASDMLLVCFLKRAEVQAFKDVDDLTHQTTLQQESMTALLDNMPALNFSKDAETGVYLYCNQGFAEYANRRSPAETVGLTDYDIFDHETAKHFVEDDKKALSMNVPHAFFEDVFDAEGNPKQFQTTKMGFFDSSGRKVLLGMCMDVTEIISIRKKIAETQTAYQKAVSESAVYESVVNALSEDYFDLYYVNVETGEYIEYGSRTEKGKPTNERRGSDFFSEARENACSMIYERDREGLIRILDKDNLLHEIQKHGAYIYHYRLLADGVPTYVSMKATRIAGDDSHIIIGISNVDTQVKDRMAAERAAEERKTYARLSALNGNLMVLYYVDPITNSYTEFSSSSDYAELGIEKQGTDFFVSTYENSLRTVHPDELALFRAQVTKENMLSVIDRDGVFMLDYRLMSGDRPTYVRLKAAKVVEEGKELLIIGLLNEDAQIRQEQKYARDLSVARWMAVRDSLTGVKNKHAYVQSEEKINDNIKNGVQEPFAVVVCDINNLKAVNDSYGHREGDACIMKGCKTICDIFSHSPVFRVGGDEFAVILTQYDYARRSELMDRINAIPEDPSRVRIGETISAGMAEYRAGEHSMLSDVFEEADRIMYERKLAFKAKYMAR